MTPSEIKDSIELSALIKNDWTKRTTIIILEIAIFIFYIFKIITNCFNFKEIGIEVLINVNYLINSTILYIVSSLTLFTIWYFTTRNKKIKKNTIGIIFAIKTENKKQHERLADSFFNQATNYIKQGTNKSVQIELLDDYHAKRIEKNKIYAAKLITKMHGNIMLYGKFEERKNNNKDIYNLTLNAIVTHSKIPFPVSNQISTEMNYVLPSEVNFDIGNEFISFKITSEFVGLAMNFILGLAFSCSKRLEEAFAMHKHCVDITTQRMTDEPNNESLLHIQKRSTFYAVEEAVYLSGIYLNQNILNKSKYYNDYALSIIPNHYNALLTKSILSFKSNNISEAMQILNQCSSNKEDYTWAYNKAFLFAFEGKFDQAYKIYRMLSTKPAVINVANQCEAFIIIYLDENPEKIELFYALGLIYYKIKEDYALAIDAFDMFITKATKMKIYPEAVSYAIIMKENCLKK